MNDSQGNEQNNHRYIVLICLIIWLSFQEISIPVIYKITGNYTVSNVCFYLKDILLIVSVAVSVMNGRFTKSQIVLISILLLSITFVIPFTEFDLSGLSSLRQILLLPAGLISGYALGNTERFRKFIVNGFFPIVILGAVIGIIGYFVDNITFWTDTIDYIHFYIDIKKLERTLVYGLPGNWFGGYGNGYFSTKRLVSFWASPLTAGYTIAFPLTYYFIRIAINNEFTIKNIIPTSILTIALWLTHTRAMLFLLILIYAVVITFNSNGIIKLLSIFCVVCTLIYIINDNTIIETISRFTYDGSTIGHINAVSNSIQDINIGLIGRGFNSYGIRGDVRTESTYITLLGNIGIIGLFAYLALALSSLYTLFGKNDDMLNVSVALTLVVYLLSGFISEQLLAFTTSIPLFLIVGSCSSYTCRTHTSMSNDG